MIPPPDVGITLRSMPADRSAFQGDPEIPEQKEGCRCGSPSGQINIREGQDCRFFSRNFIICLKTPSRMSAEMK